MRSRRAAFLREETTPPFAKEPHRLCAPIGRSASGLVLGGEEGGPRAAYPSEGPARRADQSFP
eukprot:12611827-Alexandrium_andersonii.AAC.1